MDQLRLSADLLGDLDPRRRVRIEARARIAVLRAAGHGPTAIARQLNAQGVPTPSGLLGRWRPETVGRVESPQRWSAYMRSYRRRRA